MDDSLNTISPQRLRTMQIVAFAILMGSVIFCAVVVIVVYMNNGGMNLPRQGPPIVTIVIGLAAVPHLVLSLVLPASTTRNGMRRIASTVRRPSAGAVDWLSNSDGDVLQLLALRQTSMILGLALLEGASFMCCLAYLLEGEMYVLIGVAVAVGLMLANFPTEGGVRAWLNQQLEALVKARQDAAEGGGSAPNS